jgi:hypothetical protein
MFELDKAEVRWPYAVNLLEGGVVEQVDGSVRVGGLYALMESKDWDKDVPIEPIAKLRNQLLRRPAGTAGFLFSSRSFTDPAIQLAYFTLPQAILLWEGIEVEKALRDKAVCRYAERKFRVCVDEGDPVFNIAIRLQVGS